MEVETSLKGMEEHEPIFHRVLKGGYGKAMMGKNYLANTGKMVPEKLGLANPERYRGHTFQKSSVSASATEGVKVTDLMRHHNWKNEGLSLIHI